MPKIVLRDCRKGVFFVNDDFIDSYASKIGPIASMVYIMLCRHANKNQESWPSVKKMMEKIGIGSNNSVIKAIKKLEDMGMIGVIREKTPDGKQAVNVYVLTDQSSWERMGITTVPSAPSAHGPSALSRLSRVHLPSAPSALEGNKGKDTQLKEGKQNEIKQNNCGQLTSVTDQLDEVRRQLEDTGVIRKK
jgi:hypothetical protein